MGDDFVKDDELEPGNVIESEDDEDTDDGIVKDTDDDDEDEADDEEEAGFGDELRSQFEE
jgi:hypothetical protein